MCPYRRLGLIDTTLSPCLSRGTQSALAIIGLSNYWV